ncbi:MAG: hypothetical protein AMXMBFR13_13480 [Phycisphaerae bacterium]
MDARKMIAKWASVSLGAAVFAAPTLLYAQADAPNRDQQDARVQPAAPGQADHQQSEARHGKMAKHQFSQLRRLSNMDNADIRNPQGEDLGTIEELAVDPASGRIVYAVLDTGFIAGKKHAIPFKALNITFEGDDLRFTMNANKERLEEAPGFESNNWPNMTDQRWGRDVHSFWQQRPYWEDDMGETELRGSPTGRERDRTDVDVDVNEQGVQVQTRDRDADRARGADRLGMRGKSNLIVRAGDLVGHDLLDANNKDAGELKDVLVDQKSGKLVFGVVMVDTTPDLDKDYVHPVPWQAFNVKGGERAGEGRAIKEDFQLVVNLPAEKIAQGPNFAERQWPSATQMTQQWTQNIYQHYGMKPFWESGRSIQGRNVGDAGQGSGAGVDDRAGRENK